MDAQRNLGIHDTWFALTGGPVRAILNAYVPLRAKRTGCALRLRGKLLIHVANIICNRHGHDAKVWANPRVAYHSFHMLVGQAGWRKGLARRECSLALEMIG